MANARIFYEVNTALLPLSNHDRWLNIVPNHRVAVAIGTDTHDDLESISQIQFILPELERRGLTEKLLQPKRRDQAESTKQREKAASGK